MFAPKGRKVDKEFRIMKLIIFKGLTQVFISSPDSPIFAFILKKGLCLYFDTSKHHPKIHRITSREQASKVLHEVHAKRVREYL